MLLLKQKSMFQFVAVLNSELSRTSVVGSTRHFCYDSWVVRQCTGKWSNNTTGVLAACRRTLEGALLANVDVFSSILDCNASCDAGTSRSPIDLQHNHND